MKIDLALLQRSKSSTIPSIQKALTELSIAYYNNGNGNFVKSSISLGTELLRRLSVVCCVADFEIRDTCISTDEGETQEFVSPLFTASDVLQIKKSAKRSAKSASSKKSDRAKVRKFLDRLVV